MRKGKIWMLHSVEPDSPRTAHSSLFRNLTVSPADLERKIREARDAGWTFRSGADFLARKHDAAEHQDILITIDDGFRNVYTDAFPLLRRLGVPFVFYVATGLVEHGFRICPYAQLDGMMAICDLAPKVGKNPDLCFRRYRRYRRWLPFLDGRRLLRRILGIDVDFDDYFRRSVVAPEELREMAESGFCEIGSHTDSHVHADRVRDLERELVASKRKIESWTGRPCESFSYPYGHANDRAVALVRRHFAWATKDVRQAPFEVTSDSDDHLLPRVLVKDSSSPA